MFTRLARMLKRRTSNDHIPLEQRRRGVRFACSLAVYCDTPDGHHAARLVCISEYGARLVLHVPLRVGQVVGLSYVGRLRSSDGRHSVQARVQWVTTEARDTTAGVEFIDSDAEIVSSWVYVILRRLTRSVHLDDDRKMIRYAADFAGAIAVQPRLRRGFEDGRIINLSGGGVLFEGNVEVALGSSVEVLLKPPHLPQRVLTGKVVRRPPATGVKRLGIRFDGLNRDQADWLRNVIEQLALQSLQSFTEPGAPTAESAGKMKKS